MNIFDLKIKNIESIISYDVLQWHNKRSLLKTQIWKLVNLVHLCDLTVILNKKYGTNNNLELDN